MTKIFKARRFLIIILVERDQFIYILLSRIHKKAQTSFFVRNGNKAHGIYDEDILSNPCLQIDICLQ